MLDVLIPLATAIVGGLVAGIVKLYYDTKGERVRLENRVKLLEDTLTKERDARLETAEKFTTFALSLQQKQHDTIDKLAAIAESQEREREILERQRGGRR